MEKNRILKPITPSNPSPATVIQKEKYNLFAPVAGNGQRGMAQFDTRDFKIDKDGKVSMSDNFLNMLAEALQEVNGHLINSVSIEKLSSDTDGDDYRLKFKLENEIEYICDFTAPRGLQGPQGPQGPQGEPGPQGPQGVGIPSNMSQNANKTIIVDGSVVNGNWNATFIVQQGGKERPICTQHTNYTGAKAEMVATANSAKFKFVNGTTDPQSYMEIFKDKINFSKPITVQGNPVGGGGSNALLYMQSMSSYGNYNLYFALPKDFSNVKEIKIKYTLQYDNYNYNIITNNADVIIYNEQGFFTPTLSGLFSDSYGNTETYNVSTSWNIDNISANIFTLDFYNATNYSYGGNTTYILFEIQYK